MANESLRFQFLHFSEHAVIDPVVEILQIHDAPHVQDINRFESHSF